MKKLYCRRKKSILCRQAEWHQQKKRECIKYAEPKKYTSNLINSSEQKEETENKNKVSFSDGEQGNIKNAVPTLAGAQLNAQSQNKNNMRPKAHVKEDQTTVEQIEQRDTRNK